MPTKLNRRIFIAAGAAAASMPLLPRSAAAQAASPSRNIRMVCSYFVLEPAIGFKESNALYPRELPVWLETAKNLGLEPA